MTNQMRPTSRLPRRSRLSLMQSLAQFAISHRRAVIAGWVVALVASVATAGTLKNHFNNNLTLPHTDTQRATDLLQSHFRSLSGDSDQIVFHSDGPALTAPAM